MSRPPTPRPETIDEPTWNRIDAPLRAEVVRVLEHEAEISEWMAEKKAAGVEIGGALVHMLQADGLSLPTPRENWVMAQLGDAQLATQRDGEKEQLAVRTAGERAAHDLLHESALGGVCRHPEFVTLKVEHAQGNFVKGHGAVEGLHRHDRSVALAGHEDHLSENQVRYVDGSEELRTYLLDVRLKAMEEGSALIMGHTRTATEGE